jgi:hypothetical protein
MTHLDDVDATVAIVDGRVSMTADVEGELRLETPDQLPLTKTERHAILSVFEDDVRLSIDLDAEALDALADAIYHAQGGEGDR